MNRCKLLLVLTAVLFVTTLCEADACHCKKSCVPVGCASSPQALTGSWWWYTDCWDYYSGAWHPAGRIQSPNYYNVYNGGSNFLNQKPGYRYCTPWPPRQIWVP